MINIDNINKQFDDFQKDLNEREKRIKYLTSFEIDEELDNIINELKDKKIDL